MKFRQFNWPLWTGFVLSVFAFISYPLVFVRFPITRDFPWANLALFALGAALVIMGVRRAFGSSRARRSKVAGAILATLSALVLCLFVFSVFIFARWLPASKSAPQVGQAAPDFSLVDASGKTVALSSLLSEPINGKAPKGVLLIFYRGHW